MFVYRVTRTPELSIEQLRERGVFILPRPREIGPFSLTAHTGDRFEPADLDGKWSFVFFGFTHCPDVCPTAMSVLAQAELRIADETPELAGGFNGVLITVDPERDTVEALRKYVGAFSKSFTGVGGERGDLAELAQQVNVAFAKLPGPGESYQVEHSANIVIVNPEGHYHGFIKMPHTVDTVVSTYRSLVASF